MVSLRADIPVDHVLGNRLLCTHKIIQCPKIRHPGEGGKFAPERHCCFFYFGNDVWYSYCREDTDFYTHMICAAV